MRLLCVFFAEPRFRLCFAFSVSRIEETIYRDCEKLSTSLPFMVQQAHHERKQQEYVRRTCPSRESTRQKKNPYRKEPL